MNIETVARKQLILKDRLSETRMRYETLSLSVGEAKTRIDIEPEVMSVMEELQKREHERAVGAYEELLTLFMRDVLPGYRDVELELRTERGLPALDVYMKKGEHLPREDAFSGSGGSVTNILSAGLRFISLVRSGKRPFLVLDEPDCWIKPELAPKFAAVVQSVAEQLGVQVLMISHHDEQMFETILPHRLRLEKNGANLVAQWAPTSSQPEWTDQLSGLRSIELVNFQSHAHTLIPLSPGLTLINGDNDIGKSAIVSALRCAFDADSNDSHIRHGAKSAKVFLDFGPGQILSWERFNKGKHTVIYELREAGKSLDEEPMRKSIGARDVPEWVQEFGIGLIDGIDVQLANQKEPVFLLSKPAKERAKALAIGGENAHVQEMLSIGKQEINEARLIVRSGEKELEKLHRVRQTLEVIDARDDIILALEEQSKKLALQQSQIENAEKLLLKWQVAQARQRAMRPIQHAFIEAQAAPEDHSHLARTTLEWKRARSRIEAINPITFADFSIEPPTISQPLLTTLLARWVVAQNTMAALAALSKNTLSTPPSITPEEQGKSLVRRWQRASSVRAVLEAAPEILLPAIPQGDTRSIEKIENVLARWQAANQSLAAGQEEIKTLDTKKTAIEQEMMQLGAKCPECGQLLPDHDHNLRP